MKKTLSVSLLVALGLPSGCTTYENYVPSLGAGDYVLATRKDAAGGRATYSLDLLAASGEARLRVETERQSDSADLGLGVKELDRARADNRGVQPFSGLLVTTLRVNSCGAKAGIQEGDVLLSLDGADTVYDQQLAQLEAAMKPGQLVKAKVLRGQREMELTITAEVQQSPQRGEEIVPLDAATIQHRPYTGVRLRGIPADWCERIWGTPRNAVVVTQVEAGSPAWVAGVRSGDVIETIDGAPVPNVEGVTRLIAELGPENATMEWRVRRGDEIHDATIELADYSGEANIWIPLVFHSENGSYEDRWSVGPFGLLVSNRNTYVADTATREPKTTNVFSAVLGLIRVDTSPGDTAVRLLWFFHF